MRMRLALILFAAIASPSPGQDVAAPPPPVVHAGRADAETYFTGMPRRMPAFDAVEAAGLKPGAKPIVIGWASAYRLALGGAGEARGEKLGDGEYAKLRAALASTPEDAKAPGFRDPAPEVYEALGRLHRLETSRDRHLSVVQISQVISNYAAVGGTTGVNQRDVDRMVVAEMDARIARIRRTAEYRDALDDLKARLGLPMTAPVVVDRSALDGFNGVFKDLVLWTREPNHDEAQLIAILRKLPKPVDLTIDGQPLLNAGNDSPDSGPGLIESATKGLKDARVVLRVRKRLRRLAVVLLAYQVEQATLLLAMKEADSAIALLNAPPADAPVEKQTKEMPARTTDLLKLTEDRLSSEDRLVALWIEAQVLRLGIQKDLGTLPRSWDVLATDLSARTAPVEDRK